ncbi:aconitate hydratase AcnA [Myxococcus xanthus]|uniref:Aconitate hydratase n=1 Tax=Myxococcus xanthus TaxID=34 RepID=A0AAE6KQZ1_MYXXA|nr:aconitate hydratase AcnA [Myxococcus xanthus]QDE66727.1 aconitate hydratase 1 [Myxococcus xanthus]QDE74000.1 aconitate hydratase 1 [Myxococcus xanthus]QDE95595.1 aconitate hydratase 1 [Myxococcus xanthus]
MTDSFGTKSQLKVGSATYDLFSLGKLAKSHPAVNRLPFSLKVLLENLLRHEDGRVVKREHVEKMLAWDPKATPDVEISFHPARVLLQDFTGVPAVVDLAAMREALASMGGNPDKINPRNPADLVIDHSVQIDSFATSAAFKENAELEFERNRERYAFLRWGQSAFKGFGVVPPDIGICHQVNLEFLAHVTFRQGSTVYPDTLVGTDSHTTMINGLGVVGWGVGGIEAEAALLGQPITMLIPQVVGFKLSGKLPAGATATDLVLTVTQMLRKKGVVGKFVEFYGSGLKNLSLPDRATIANMAPEYGATIGFFPVDEESLNYLRFTGRPDDLVALTEAYAKEQGLWRRDDAEDPLFSDTLELDLSTVVPSLAGPKRPQDRVPLKDMKSGYEKSLVEMLSAGKSKGEDEEGGKGKAAAAAAVPPERLAQTVTVKNGRQSYQMGHGAVVIASITSCTNTSNPAVLVGAGILAKKAVERGLNPKPWVKTSLAPGSRVVSEYLRDAGLLPYLEAVGFHIVGYGCTTCIGNSGPLTEPVANAVTEGDLVVAAVLSGNRNFEGRINPHVRMNYLASPPLVVAYALAGEVGMDLDNEPLGTDPNGRPVFLKDIWPTNEEIQEVIRTSVKPEQFRSQYANAMEGDALWQQLPVGKGSTFQWDDTSTYVRKPPFFENLPKEPKATQDIHGAHVMALLGDSVTTDHISPAGNIAKTSPAAKYLMANGVEPKDFNSYGARRGNHEVMVRGTFANIRLKNLLVPGVEGGVTVHIPTRERMSIYDASMKYQAEGTPLVVLAGAEYGTGSSRDWAAKGTMLLGVKAVIAKSFERIHRSNLVGMGVLPLQFEAGQDAQSLGLTGHEKFDITGVAQDLAPQKKLTVKATGESGTKEFTVVCRIDTPNELDYYRHGGILQYVLRQLAKA